MKKVKHVRMINGEELLAVIENEDAEAYLLLNPLVVSSYDDGQTERTVLMRYTPYSRTSTVRIQKFHVIACSDVHPEMTRHYNLSLKISADGEKASIDALREANSRMEASLLKPRSKKSKSTLLVGNNTRH